MGLLEYKARKLTIFTKITRISIILQFNVVILCRQELIIEDDITKHSHTIAIVMIGTQNNGAQTARRDRSKMAAIVMRVMSEGQVGMPDRH